MTRRRFLRATSLTLLILCLVAWGWGNVRAESISYAWPFRLLELRIEPRGIVLECDTFKKAGDGGRGWKYSQGGEFNFRLLALVGARESAGFAVCDANMTMGQLVALRIPWWFITLALAVLTCWTWRKRRVKDGRGFAVDGAGEKANESTAEASAP